MALEGSSSGCFWTFRSAGAAGSVWSFLQQALGQSVQPGGGSATLPLSQTLTQHLIHGTPVPKGRAPWTPVIDEDSPSPVSGPHPPTPASASAHATVLWSRTRAAIRTVARTELLFMQVDFSWQWTCGPHDEGPCLGFSPRCSSGRGTSLPQAPLAHQGLTGPRGHSRAGLVCTALLFIMPFRETEQPGPREP